MDASDKLIADNFVEYHIFLPSHLSPSDLLIHATLYLNFLSKYTKDYVWNLQPFTLRIKSSHLWGRVFFGNNIDDEWFIVFLLFELSRKHPELVISIVDNDDQFLLIESALHLPKWLKPENSKNRIFVKSGTLIYIPLPTTPAQLISSPVFLDISNSLALIRDNQFKDFSDEVQNSILSRISGFPDSISKNFHWTRCILPKSIAYLLEKMPKLIAPVTLAFCDRDYDAQKALNLMKHFGNKSSQTEKKEEWISTGVKFTKCLFAQLQQQHFLPPKKLGITLPPSTHPDYKPILNGVKILCGFEIILSRPDQKNSPSPGPLIKQFRFEEEPLWEVFQSTLLSHPDFQEQRSGTTKETLIQEHYLRLKRKDFDRYLTLPEVYYTKDLVNSLLKDFELNNHLPLSSSIKEDSEDWLYVSPESLESILKNYPLPDSRDSENTLKKNKNKAKETAKDKAQEDKQLEELEGLLGGMRRFVNTLSDIDGADFPSMSSGIDTQQFSEDVLKIARSAMKTQSPGPEEESGEEEEEEEEEGFYSGTEDDEQEGEEDGESLQKTMARMDKELNTTSMGKSFSGAKQGGMSEQVNLDHNLLSNILESFSVQEGNPGPFSNLFGALNDHKSSKENPKFESSLTINKN